jgi:hypothetical protein
MKDRRVSYVRGVLSELVESLDATMRIARWQDDDAVPPPLRASADLLVERLGKANRLANDRYAGSSVAVQAISAMSTAIQRLDLAFVAYRNSPEREDTVLALDAELARVRADSELDLAR